MKRQAIMDVISHPIMFLKLVRANWGRKVPRKWSRLLRAHWCYCNVVHRGIIGGV